MNDVHFAEYLNSSRRYIKENVKNIDRNDKKGLSDGLYNGYLNAMTHPDPWEEDYRIICSADRDSIGEIFIHIVPAEKNPGTFYRTGYDFYEDLIRFLRVDQFSDPLTFK